MGFFRSLYYYAGIEYIGEKERNQYQKQKILKILMLNHIRQRGQRNPSYITLNDFICIPIKNFNINNFVKI
jgi:hypothetical protein